MERNVKCGGEPLLSKVYNENDEAYDFLAQCANEFSKEVRANRPDLGQGQDQGCRDYLNSLFSFDELNRMLDQSFLPANMRDDISEALKETQDRLPPLCGGSCKDGFPEFSFSEDAILDYLNSYYSLQYLLLYYYDGLKQWKEGQDFLRKVLCFGCDFSYPILAKADVRAVGVMTPLAPCYLSGLLELTQEKYCYNNDDWSRSLVPQRAAICKEILRAYTRRYMNWCVTVPKKRGGQLCRARLRMYTENELEKTLISLPIIPLKETSSFEGVSELRLFEKIKYELERKPKYDKDAALPFQVALLGEIDSEMFVNFCQLLDGWLERDRGTIQWADKDDLRFQFVIVTKNRFPDKDILAPFKDTRIQYELRDYDTLFSDSREYTALVGSSNLILLLDCYELYEPIRLSPYPGLNPFLQRAARSSYQTGKNAGLPETALASGNIFLRMYSLLTGAAYGDGTPAFLEKVARKQLLYYLDDVLKQSPKGGTAYAYFSDLTAAGELYWEDVHFLRVEEYVCKQIAILQFGGKAEEKLKNAECAKERVLVFNLWQFIKHTALHRLDSIMEFFRFPATDYYSDIFWLSETQIGVNYADWKRSLKFYYDVEKIPNMPQFESRLKEYLTTVIIPFFMDQQRNLYTYYLRKCTTAFLYSDAKNVDDMLFLHLFERKHMKLRYDGAEPEKRELRTLMCHKKKYSGKRFYQEIIADYDGPSQFFANQYRKREIMERSGQLETRVVFKLIQRACEENDYTDSYLYQNCLENLKYI